VGQGATGVGLDPYGQTPLAFEVNAGQAGSDGSDVRFLSHGPGYGLWLDGQGGATFAVVRPGTDGQPSPGSDVFSMAFEGANPAKVLGAGLLPSKSNYFIGDPSQWLSNIDQYAGVSYQGLYNGIDLNYQAAPGSRALEYTLTAQPGADLSQIRLRFDGLQNLSTDPQGDIVLRTGGPAVREGRFTSSWVDWCSLASTTTQPSSRSPASSRNLSTLPTRQGLGDVAHLVLRPRGVGFSRQEWRYSTSRLTAVLLAPGDSAALVRFTPRSAAYTSHFFLTPSGWGSGRSPRTCGSVGMTTARKARKVPSAATFLRFPRFFRRLAG
jgi:hypothetical protein